MISCRMKSICKLYGVLAMASIVIDLSDSQLQKLQELAKVYGISADALLRASVEDWLSSPKEDFIGAAEYAITKNTELYERLA